MASKLFMHIFSRTRELTWDSSRVPTTREKLCENALVSNAHERTYVRVLSYPACMWAFTRELTRECSRARTHVIIYKRPYVRVLSYSIFTRELTRPMCTWEFTGRKFYLEFKLSLLLRDPSREHEKHYMYLAMLQYMEGGSKGTQVAHTYFTRSPVKYIRTTLHR